MNDTTEPTTPEAAPDEASSDKTLTMGIECIEAVVAVKPGQLRLAVAAYFNIPPEDVTAALVAQYEQET
jgi:hypothetical protein